MANFGFRDLVVVAPYGPAWREARSAVGAEEITQAARSVETVVDALDGVTLAVGTTSGQRRTPDRELTNLRLLPAWIKRQSGRGRRGGTAILFGSEKTGLSNEQLSYCHVLVRIPTIAGCPSMNLGQAVAVCCYELARPAGRSAGLQPGISSPAGKRSGISISASLKAGATSGPATVQSLDHILERAARVLDDVGYLKPKSREATMIKLRRALLGRRLSNNDAKIIGGVLAQIEWKLADVKKQ